MPVRRTVAIALTSATLTVLAILPASVAAASSVVECGQLTGYAAPDPAGPTDGSVQLGLSDTWTILPTATISANAAAALPTSVNNGPTCLAMDLDDDGNVTALDFTPTGTLSGTVDFDSGSGFYLFAGRLIVPDFITNMYPGLAALVVTSYQAGTSLTITFSVDTTNGGFTGFDGTAAFCGKGSVTPGGDGKVGDAVIPGSVLDTDDLDALASAGSRQTCATVHSIGTIDPNTGNIDITTDVDIVVAAAGTTVTPPPTSTEPVVSTPAGSGPPLVVWLALVLAGSVVVVTRRTRPSRR